MVAIRRPGPGRRRAGEAMGAPARWGASDRLGDRGRPRRLRHGGLGLVPGGNLDKPKYGALRLAGRHEDSRPTHELGQRADG